MSVSRNERLAELVVLMRDKKTHLNSNKFRRESGFEVSQKTFLRDIQYLRDVRGAKIEYDASEKVFYMKGSFDYPLFNGGDIRAAMLAMKFAEGLLPEPMKSQMRKTLMEIAVEQGAELAQEEDFDCFAPAFKNRTQIDPEIGAKLFSVCVNCRTVLVNYRSADGQDGLRKINPHLLVERSGIWYVQAEMLESDGVAVEARPVVSMALHRMLSIVETGRKFVRDRKLKRKIEKEGLFSNDRVENVLMRFSPQAAPAVKEQHAHVADEKTTELEDGSLELFMPSASRRHIIKWVMASRGDAAIVEPKGLAQELLEAIDKAKCIQRKILKEGE